MKKTKRVLRMFRPVFIVIYLLATASMFMQGEPGNVHGPAPAAEERISSSGITWIPRAGYSRFELTVSPPVGPIFHEIFEPGTNPFINLSNLCGDGSYSYELRVIPNSNLTLRGEETRNVTPGKRGNLEEVVQSGNFLVKDGIIITSDSPERISRPLDIVQSDDLIITGDNCIGDGCATDGSESFGYDSIKIKNVTPRIFFDDTSSSPYPLNDWRLLINDTSSGGVSHFSIEDTTAGRRPFTIRAGTRSNALYVDDAGYVGLGTSVPAEALHITSCDTPGIRLEQTTCQGYAAQNWDLLGNEQFFSVRDYTDPPNWTMPLKIAARAPMYALYLHGDGKIGLGTGAPTVPLDLRTSGIAATFNATRSAGATASVSADTSLVYIGAKSNHDLRLVANDSSKMTIKANGNIGIGTTAPIHLIHLSGGAYSDGATWVDSSSKVLKENIQSLGKEEALNALNNLSPVKFNYKTDKEEKHVGFIAEDAPELVATKDRKGMSSMDVVAVLTKVLQEQQKSIQEQQQTIVELKEKIARLEKK